MYPPEAPEAERESTFGVFASLVVDGPQRTVECQSIGSGQP